MLGGYRQVGSKAVLSASLLLSGLVHSVFADNATTVPSSSYSSGSGNDEILVAVNVPAGGDNTDLYFHFEAPANGVAWAAFGMGSRMDEALMFIVYRSADNIGEPTISPRIGSGHSMPTFASAVNISILEGSEATADRFVANFHCHNCRSWGVGQVDVTSTSAPFIYAIGPESDLQSDDRSVILNQHSTYKNGWSQNMKSATGTNGIPLVGTSSGSTGSTSNNTSSGSNSGSDDDDNVIYVSAGVLFHGAVMALAFSLIYPLGYLFLRLFERVWLHAGVNSLGLLLTVLGVGSGIAVSKRDQISPKINHPHQILGLIIFALILATWTIGLIGHAHFKRTQTPHPLMKGHKILGPLSIALGFANACIGFAWVGMRGAIIAYVVFSLLVSVIISGLVFMKNKKKMRRQGAVNSMAANNFRDGQGVQMQPMDQEHGRVEYVNVNAGK